MSLEEEIATTIKLVSKRYALVLDNGRIIDSTIAESNVIKLTQFLPNIIEKLKHNNYIHKKVHKWNLYIYRLSSHFIIILLTEKSNNEIKLLFKELHDKYALKIKRRFSKLQNNLKTIFKSVVFSMARDLGPEPVTYLPKDLPEQDAFTIAMKSLILLSGEMEGAKKEMLSFQPFIKFNSLGVIYLFQTEFKNARGGAYDSAISLLLDYSSRAAIYEMVKKLEAMMKKISLSLKQKFQENADKEGQLKDNTIFNPILEKFIDSLEALPLKMQKSDMIMDEMIKSLNNLKKG
ncbi:MAG: hypothetical protein ACTSU2_12340 [Promethearchaeota archaeon]